MALNDRPNMLLVILSFIIGVLLATDAGCDPVGICINVTPWAPPIMWGAFGLAVALLWNWFMFQTATQLLWRNTAKSVRTHNALETLRAVASMDLARLEAFVNVLYVMHGEPEDRAAALADLRGAVDAMKREAERAANYDTGRRWYAVDVLNEARKRDGWLPALHGPQTAERDTRKAFYDRLVKEGAARAAIGPKPPQVTDWERAEQVARTMGA